MRPGAEVACTVGISGAEFPLLNRRDNPGGWRRARSVEISEPGKIACEILATVDGARGLLPFFSWYRAMDLRTNGLGSRFMSSAGVIHIYVSAASSRHLIMRNGL